MYDRYGLLEKVVKNNNLPILVLSPPNSPVESKFKGIVGNRIIGIETKLAVSSTDLRVYSKIRKGEGSLLVCGVDNKEINGYSNNGVDIREGVHFLRNVEKMGFPTILLTYCLKQNNYFNRGSKGNNPTLKQMVDEMPHVLCSSLEKKFEEDLLFVLGCYLKGEFIAAGKDTSFYQKGLK